MCDGAAEHTPPERFVLRQAQETRMRKAVTAHGEGVEANKRDQANVAAGGAELSEHAAGYRRIGDEQHSTDHQRDGNPADGAAAHHKLLNTLSSRLLRVSISVALMSLKTDW